MLDEDYGILTPIVYKETFTTVSICWKPETLRGQNVSTPIVYGPGDTADDMYTNPANMAWCQPSGDPRAWADDVLRPLSGGVVQDLIVFVHSEPGDKFLAVMSNGTYYSSASPDVESPILQRVFGSGPGPLVETYMPGITASLTHNNLNFDSPSLLGYGTGSNLSSIVNHLPGTVWSQQVFVHVRWAYLTLPVILTVAAAAFMAITAYQTRRQHLPLWKSSTMALLYHGLAEDLIDEHQSYQTASGMADVAGGVYVRLGTTDEGEDEGEGRGRMHLRT